MGPTPTKILKTLRAAHTDLHAARVAAETALTRAERDDETAQAHAIAATKRMVLADENDTPMAAPLRFQAKQQYDVAQAAHTATRAARAAAIRNLIAAHADIIQNTQAVYQAALDTLDPSGQTWQLFLSGSVQLPLLRSEQRDNDACDTNTCTAGPPTG